MSFRWRRARSALSTCRTRTGARGVRGSLGGRAQAPALLDLLVARVAVGEPADRDLSGGLVDGEDDALVRDGMLGEFERAGGGRAGEERVSASHDQRRAQ